MKPHPMLILVLVGALLGFVFAGVSTYDFEQHLDRQVHNVHCSFVPGLTEPEVGGSDCEVTLMSPYSSVFRSSIWGGVPISLAAMAVFGFLVFFGLDLIVTRRQRDSRAAGFLALATVLPAGTSLVMAFISLGQLDAACKSCIGIYTGSGLALVGAIGLWIRARSHHVDTTASAADLSDPAWASSGEADGGAAEEAAAGPPADAIAEMSSFGSPREPNGPISYAMLGAVFGLGVLFVAVPVGAYIMSAPDQSRFVGTCGQLDQPPKDELLVDVGPQTGVDALEVFDPLCPACRGFEQHLEQTRYKDKLARRALMFPLDDECNWMIDQAVHPGACAVSEAVLCADDNATGVIDWAFDHQEKIRTLAGSTAAGPERVREMIGEHFPELDSCVGSPKARARLNQSLRWAVDAQLKVLTPQVYIDGVRLCDEDVDLGLEFALSTMLDRHANGTLGQSAPTDQETP